LANSKSFFNNLKRSPENQFYRDLVTLLELRLNEVTDELIESQGDATLKLQGKAQELKTMLKGLALKARKFDDHYTDSYGS
jgi:hypothetical protein